MNHQGFPGVHLLIKELLVLLVLVLVMSELYGDITSNPGPKGQCTGCDVKPTHGCI